MNSHGGHIKNNKEEGFLITFFPPPVHHPIKLERFVLLLVKMVRMRRLLLLVLIYDHDHDNQQRNKVTTATTAKMNII